MNKPMDLIKFKKANCKNCYKCIRHCPVKSIRFSGNQAYIIDDECIYCGQCFVVCPQNAKVISDSTEEVKALLAGDSPVVASIAPSFVANFDGVGIAAIETALKKLGFDSAEETALGATMVKTQYENILKNGSQEFVISTSCHTVNLLVQKFFPGAVPYLADVVTPMHAHCLDIKKRIPNAKTVFIGPCISKKDEARQLGGVVDAVMTFSELSSWLESEGIQIEKSADKNAESKARIFPTSGGIIKSMNLPDDNYGYQIMAVDGLDHCMMALKDIESGVMTPCFIEMSACPGSCIGGPVMEKYHPSPVRDYARVSAYSGSSDFPIEILPESELVHEYEYRPVTNIMPGQKDIERILKQMGKTLPSHELNCGSCGYNTCREKAVAVYQGKADFSMCLPFLTDKAESFSDNIIQNTPNGIMVLNGNYEIQQINKAACAIFALPTDKAVLGEPIVRLLDPTPFMDLKESPRSVSEYKSYLPEYKKYIESTLIYEEEHQIFICIMTDVTDKMEEKLSREALNRKTAETADKVIERQMHIVQEIASLLGETTAETKIALTKLKESIADE